MKMLNVLFLPMHKYRVINGGTQDQGAQSHQESCEVKVYTSSYVSDRPKTRCVKYVPKCASARVAPSNIVYTWYGYRSTGTGVLTTEVLLFRQYLNK